MPHSIRSRVNLGQPCVDELSGATRHESKSRRTRRRLDHAWVKLFALLVTLGVSAQAQTQPEPEQSSTASDPAAESPPEGPSAASKEEPSDEAPASASQAAPASSPTARAAGRSGDVLISSGDGAEQPKTAQLTDSSVLTKVRSPGEEQRRKKEKPATRWSEVGAIVGMTSRPSSDDRFKYRPGIAYGGFFRPQITDYLGISLSYREERISVQAAPNAYDYEGSSTESLELEQSPLKVTSLGVRIEPSYPITRFLHLQGVLSWSWVRIVYPMPHGPDFEQRADRAGVELNWGLGGGVSVDLLRNWVNLGLMGAYHFVSNQTGSAYEPIQAVVDGQMTHFAPMARPKHLVDVMFSLGIIL